MTKPKNDFSICIGSDDKFTKYDDANERNVCAESHACTRCGISDKGRKLVTRVPDSTSYMYPEHEGLATENPSVRRHAKCNTYQKGMGKSKHHN